MAEDSAAERLDAAFAARADRVRGDVVGVFGDGLPEALIVAAGGVPAEVKAPPPGDDAPSPVAAVIEPFMDEYARRFLHRFAAGRFDGMAALIFCRDDVAGLTAYQYAAEMRRQGIVGPGGPRLFLWNLLHTDSAAAHRFNVVQAGTLAAFLRETLERPPGDLAPALAAEGRRLAAVRRMEDAPTGAARALAWRNAGRWLAADAHAALLDAAVPEASPAAHGPRLALIGTAICDPALHAVFDEIGHLVTDLQPYGRPWPECHAGGPDLDGLLRAVAAYPLHIRAAPPQRFGEALLAGLEGCDVVVSQVDENDDAFGWEVPRLRARLADRGVPLVDLGFRPFRPGADWLATARHRIGEALQ